MRHAPRFRSFLCLAGTVLIAGATPAAAHHKPGHQGGPPAHAFSGGGEHGDRVTISPSGIDIRFDDVVFRLVNDWYRANPQTYASYAGLPPGIAMRLARGKPLPPGIAKRFLPAGLTSILPPPPAGYGRFIVGDDLVLIELTTGLIADVMSILAR